MSDFKNEMDAIIRGIEVLEFCEELEKQDKEAIMDRISRIAEIVGNGTDARFTTKSLNGILDILDTRGQNEKNT